LITAMAARQDQRNAVLQSMFKDMDETTVNLLFMNDDDDIEDLEFLMEDDDDIFNSDDDSDDMQSVVEGLESDTSMDNASRNLMCDFGE